MTIQILPHSENAAFKSALEATLDVSIRLFRVNHSLSLIIDGR
jgi:hypothetical protein